ncbi:MULTISPECIES: transglycosylase SLT domain-containing protein [Streptomycetaceae]|uniref:Transglycosylase SLT domain-containing protein n=1 Tax=Streptantibioticus cattleyicolor (strain ATCC 35852 / DSM 46488 / JCM 4925 / NBRC 14057 / NRRL 8057) TaxID=1003195 RepID=F8JU31_STREN|nr:MULTISPECIES: transglycosylase SLT domain-containing protein [Streptomycetaceae]AEW93043.1 hypothetical protein SCATT_06720 [Streptantibioticus cattleyicolor NRRL 8057 = DSM 46488]MYS57776.1 transglycosylase SLT domain-containing protein [Streptomyces sp. SID5468]CCB73401.1 conserved exported protein of unknown function [Streptantibioticus cattleyicolor NRRL 8057 = DSM 46488]
MPRHARARWTRSHKISAAGVVAVAGAASLAFAVAPGSAQPRQQAATVSTESIAWEAPATGAQLQHDGVARQSDQAGRRARDEQRAHRAAEARQRAADAAKAAEAAKAQAAQQQAAAAVQQRATAQPAVTRSALRVTTLAARTTTPAAAPVKATVYPDNLDGWIRQSLAVMAQRGIPGSYNGIKRNVMRESSGNPHAINLTDSNAAKGIPSKGLLQVIQPTFTAYHVTGTSWDIYDPVANITAACNYAAHRYGSIDNVNSAY